MTIARLDDDTVRKIAAGEVVERPVSVVKELLENSLDADATRVDVAVEAGGIDRIRVADDGVGMTREEVELAVEEHTTSKIEGIDDLEAGVGTLGFRGEALHAIGSVSHTEITTRPRGGDRGTELRIDHGEIEAVEPAGRPEGTTVDVTDLFGETPARRKFLKTESTEFDHVNRMVTRYALANPSVAVSLIHDGRELFATTGQSDLAATILDVYGREVAESMIELDYQAPEDAPVDRVRGFVSHPETTRSTREYVSTFVNDRYVAATELRRAIVDAYGGQLAADRYPFAVVFVDLPSAAVDVNVHPRKLEVRFGDEAGVRAAVREAVETALLDHGLVRSGAPRGRSAPEDVDLPGESADDAASGPADVGPTGDALDSDADADSEPEPEPQSPSASEPDEDGATAVSRPDRTADPSADTESELRGQASGSNSASSASTTDETQRAAPDPDRDAASIRDPGTQERLDTGVTTGAGQFDRLPDMRLLGQLDETYALAETGEGLLLVDQHAADERITYERLQDQLATTDAQTLAEPVEIELTAREAALFEDHRDAIEELGFRVERSGDRALTVTGVPAVVADALAPARIRDVLNELLEDRETTSVDARRDAVLSDLACHPAITGSTSLPEGSIRRLLSELDECENPYACPHGRPVLVEIDYGEIEDRFERDYPGHDAH